MWEKSNFLSTEAAGLSGTSLVRMITGLAKHDKLGEAVVISGNGQFISVRSPKNQANCVLNSGTKVEESKNTEQSHQVRVHQAPIYGVEEYDEDSRMERRRRVEECVRVFYFFVQS